MCCVLPFVALVVFGLVAGDPDEDQAEEATTDTTAEPTTTTAEPEETTTGAPETTVFDDRACTPAAAEVVGQLQASLTGEGWTLDRTFVVNGGDGPVVGASILNADGTKRWSAEVFTIIDGQAYAVTSGARQSSSLPDGGELVDQHYENVAMNCVLGRQLFD